MELMQRFKTSFSKPKCINACLLLVLAIMEVSLVDARGNDFQGTKLRRQLADAETCNEGRGDLSFQGITMATSFERKIVSLEWDPAVLVSNDESLPLDCDLISYDVFVALAPYNFSDISVEELIQEPIVNHTSTTALDLNLDDLQGGETYSILVTSNADDLLFSSNRESIEIIVAENDPVISRNVTKIVSPIEPSEVFIVTISDEANTVTFSGTIPLEIQELEPTNHIAGTASNGDVFLFYVEAVEVLLESSIIVTVLDATLADVFEVLDFDACFDTSKQIGATNPPESRRLAEFSLFDRTFVVDETLALGPLTLQGKVELTAYLRVEIKIRWFKKVSGRVTMGGGIKTLSRMQFEETAGYSNTFERVVWEGKEIRLKFTIYFVPVFIFLNPSLTLELSVDVELKASAEIKLTQEGRIQASAFYDEGWGTSSDQGYDQDLSVELLGEATAAADAGALLALDVSVYKAFGVNLGVKPGVKWEAAAELILNNDLLFDIGPPYELTQFDVNAYVTFPVVGTSIFGDRDFGSIYDIDVPLLTLPEADILSVNQDMCQGDDAMVLTGQLKEKKSEALIPNNLQEPHLWIDDFSPLGKPENDPAAPLWQLAPADGETFVLKLPRSAIGSIPMYKLPSGNIFLRTTPELPPLSKSLLTSEPLLNLFNPNEFECCEKEDCDLKYRDDEYDCAPNKVCAIPSFCKDTDDGINLSQQGSAAVYDDDICTEKVDGTEMTDYCVDETLLREYYCSPDEGESVADGCTKFATVQYLDEYCEFGCDQGHGKCKPPTSCYDSDMGMVENKKGTIGLYEDDQCTIALQGTLQFTDYCLNENTLVEYYCYLDGDAVGDCTKGAEILHTEIECEFGCDKGRCCDRQKDGGCGGDPHFHTWHGEYFGYHGVCDLVLVHSSSFGDGLGMDIHIRTKEREGYSSISNVALRIGTDILEILNDGTVAVNGILSSADVELITELADSFEVTKNIAKESEIFLPDVNHGFTEPEINESTMYTVNLGNGDFIQIQAWKDYLWVNVRGGKEHFHDSVGLMGTWDKPGKIARDGITVIEDPNEFGEEWQVQSSEPKLFQTIRAPQHPNACLPAPTSSVGRRLGQVRQAEEACAHLEGPKKEFCLFDVAVTGDTEIARAYRS